MFGIPPWLAIAPFYFGLPFLDNILFLFLFRYITKSKIHNKLLFSDSLLLLIPIILEDQLRDFHVLPHILPIVFTNSQSKVNDILLNSQNFSGDFWRYSGAIIRIPASLELFSQIFSVSTFIVFFLILLLIAIFHWKGSKLQMLIFLVIGSILGLSHSGFIPPLIWILALVGTYFFNLIDKSK